MRSKAVTEVWEFYRDNAVGFKEPMRKRLRELDAYVAGLEEEVGELRRVSRATESSMIDGGGA